ncbi:S-layer homology domain-containing protein [Paenibacillus sp. NPDC058910]|uniref:S-layer homology domain-containing protein n=1 Tax=unclassified Paenibacillus TaxID=185978 RepID=UPI0036C4736F
MKSSNAEQAVDLQAFELMGDSAAAINGASYDKDKDMLRFYIDHVGVYAIDSKNPAAFTDLGKHEWAREAIEKLAERGIVNSTSIEKGTFSPANQVTRADFILMLVNMLDLRAEIASTFADVKPNDYYYDAVSIAKQLGIASGVNEVNFAPRDSTSRQDAIYGYADPSAANDGGNKAVRIRFNG